MIQLEAVRLINWYHFVDETFAIAGNALFLGDNGSGKSTVLDAIQLVLVADMNQIRFNKAANEQSHRTLYGYVRYKLGSEDESRPGVLRFGRGGCTSYVLLQFSAGRNGAPPFVAGVVLEAAEHDTQVARNHFLVPDARVSDLPVLIDADTVRPLREYRTKFRDVPQARWFQENSEYRAELRQRLGTLPEDFHRVIARALAFRPLGDIRDFVFAYLLDPRPVDTAALQNNLENYKRLEAQAKDAEVRIAELAGICALGERIAAERRTAESHQYVYLKADVDLAREAETRVQRQIEDTITRQGELEEALVSLDERKRVSRQERDRYVGLMTQIPEYHMSERMKLELDDTRRQITLAAAAETSARTILQQQEATLTLLLSQNARDLRQRRQEWMAQSGVLGAGEEPAVVSRLREAIRAQGGLGGRDLATWIRRLEEAYSALLLLKGRLEDAFTTAKKEGDALHEEQRQLDLGRQTYRKEVAALLHLLRTRLKGKRDPQPFCELIEVPNERWRDAVEGYLNTRRFDVLVAPEDFPRALSLYDRHKREYHLPGVGPVFIAGVGLVDIERLRGAVRPPERRSLAEQIVTTDPLARDYANYVLGDVICCETEQELRQHRTGITDSVMVYRNHVARQTPPEVFRRHYIGAAAQARRSEEIHERLGELAAELVVLGDDLAWVAKAVDQCKDAVRGVQSLSGHIEHANKLKDLRFQEVATERLLQHLDRREVDRLDAEIRRIGAELDQCDRQHDANLREQGECATRLDTLREAADGKKVERQTAERILAEACVSMTGEREATLAAHYTEVTTNRPLAEARKTFEQQHRTVLSRIDNWRDQLVQLKTTYVNKRQFGGECGGEGYGDFAEERDLWRESRLPEYADRIAKAKQQALEQLAEDIIFRLRENLVDVRRQIGGLNQALKEVAFGADRYEFTLEVNPEHKEFHDVIMEAGHFQQDSLFGEAAMRNPATRQTLEELLNQLIQSEASRVKTELEAKADYREYFDYDLRIHHPDGTSSRYSRVSGDKSGGETQNPYYIAIFASLYRLYRRLSPDGQPACGLVLLDEAFSKMDEYRIGATLKFARALGLQLILATPKERSELVIPLVESSLYIYRDPQTGVPTVLTYDREFGANGQPARNPAIDPV